MDFTEASLPKPLALLYKYWQQKRGDRQMPSRADINPVEMQEFLPHTMLLDVHKDEQGGTIFKARLVGTHIVHGYGNEFTGKTSYELIPGNQMDDLYAACLHSVDAKKPAYLNGQVHLPTTDEHVAFERLGVPLSTDGENVDILLIAAIVRRGPRPF